MNIEIVKYKYFETKSENEIITVNELNSNDFSNATYLTGLKERILSLSNNANILLDYPSSDADLLLKNLRLVLTYIKSNKNITNIKLIISSNDYEHACNKVRSNLYSEVINYSSKDFNVIVLECAVIKIIGKKNAKKARLIYNLLSKIKCIIYRAVRLHI